MYPQQFNRQPSRQGIQNQPRINDNFLMNSMQGAMNQMYNRSSSEISNPMRMNRSPTIDQFQNQFQQSSAPSGKNRPAIPNQGYVQPFAAQDFGRPDTGFNRQTTFMNQSQNMATFPQNQNFGQMIDQSAHYDQSYQNNPQGTGDNFYHTQSMIQLQQPPNQRKTLDISSIFTKMALDGVLKEPNLLKEADGYLERKFEVWELAVIFPITIPEARFVVSYFDKEFKTQVEFQQLCQKLNEKLPPNQQINFQNYAKQSTYSLKPILPEFKQLASALKRNSEFTPNSGSYQEAFYQIAKKNSSNHNKVTVQHLQFTLANLNFGGQNLSGQKLKELINFILCSEQQTEITVVQFVCAMRAIEMDYQLMDLSALMRYIKDLKKVKETLDPSILLLRKVIFEKQNVNLEDYFKSVQEHQIDKNGQKTMCAKQTELESFIDTLLKISVLEKQNIVKNYKVEPIITPKNAQKDLTQQTAKQFDAQQSVQNQQLANITQNNPAQNTSAFASNTLNQTIAQAKIEEVIKTDPSSDSLKRDPDGLIQSYNPNRAASPSAQRVIEEVVEDMDQSFERNEEIEEDEFEYSYDADQKEGGQKEKFSYIDYTKLKFDLLPSKEMQNQQLQFATTLKFDILEQIKVWLVVTGGQVLNTFKQSDRKGSLLAGKRQIESFLSKIIDDQKRSTDKMVTAILTFFCQINSHGFQCIDYMQFYTFFLRYASSRTETDPVFVADYSWISQKGKSLGKIMNISPSLISQQKPIEVLLSDFDTKLDNEKIQLNVQQKGRRTAAKQLGAQTTLNANIVQKIKGVEKDKVDLIKFQELLGFIEESEPQFVDEEVSFTSVSIILQSVGLNYKQLKQQLTYAKNQNDIFQVIYSNFQNDTDNKNYYSIVNKINSFAEGQNIKKKELLANLEFEMKKLLQLERFYIRLKQEKERNKNDLLDDSKDTKYWDQNFRDSGEMPIENFQSMLEDLDFIAKLESVQDQQDEQLIQLREQEFSYFREEYEAEESKVISIQKLKNHYIEFVDVERTCVLDRLSELVYEKIAVGCILSNQTDIFSFLQGAQNFQQQDDASPRKVQISQISNEFLHTYDFIQWFKDLQGVVASSMQNSQPTLDNDLLTVVIEYLTIDYGSKNKLSIYQLAKRIILWVQDVGQNMPYLNPLLNQQSGKKDLVKSQFQKLLLRIVEVLEYLEKLPQDYFQGYTATIEMFETMLRHDDFCLFNLGLTVPIKDIGQSFAKEGQIIIQEFNQQIFQLMNEREKKFLKFKEINKNLDQNGLKIEQAVKMVHGSQIEKFGFTIYDFKAVCNFAQLPVQIEDLQIILDTFEPDQFGEVPKQNFINEFKKALQKQMPDFMKTSEIQDKEEVVVVAQRNFKTIHDVIEEIQRQIDNKPVKDLGSYLKGNDYNDDDHITNSCFFLLIQKIFTTLGKGDILDVIQSFDPNNTGKINIVEFARHLNVRLNNQIKLKSAVSGEIDQKMIQTITPRQKTSIAQSPQDYRKTFIDLFSGLLNRKLGTLNNWLMMFSHSQQNCISYIEFKAALEKADVMCSQEIKLAIFEFLKAKQDHEYSHTYCNILQLVAQVGLDFPHQDVDSIVYEILQIMVPILFDNQIAVRDSCKKYETAMGSGEILYSDFQFQLISQEWKMKSVLSPNMNDLLQHKYNPYQSQNIPYELLITGLQYIASQLKIKLFMTQIEIDEHNHNIFQTTGQSFVRKTVAAKIEPSYEVKSKKNTYFDGQLFGINNLTDQKHIKYCDDILISTREKGMSVEQHFQRYGAISKKDGLRHIDAVKFRDALTDLQLEWAYNSEQIKQFYSAIETAVNIEKSEIGIGLTLENIGCIVFMNSIVDLFIEEANALEMVYRAIVRNGLINIVQDLFNFHNFERDGTATLHEFQILLFDTFKLRNQVPDKHINILIQRYRIPSTSQNQIVSQYIFMQDIAYSHIGIGLMIQWAAKLAENIVKQIHTKEVLETSSGLNLNLSNELQSYFQRYTSSNIFTYGDMLRSFQNLNLVSRDADQTHKQMDNLFKLASKTDINIQNVDVRTIETLPQHIKFEQLIITLTNLAKKPIEGLYHDTLDQVYISSKKRKVSISGPYLLFLFEEDDLSKTNTIPFELFVKRIQEKVQTSNDVSVQDIQFLASKYVLPYLINTGQNYKLVNYKLFLDDYYFFEKGNLGECLKILFQKHKIQKEITSLDKLSEQDQQIYIKMGKYLLAKDLDEMFCGEMIQKDYLKEGHLTKEQIKDSVKRVGVPISENQISQLTKHLSQQEHKFNYLELIAFLFTSRYMQRIQTENSIFSAREIIKPIIDLASLSLSTALIREIELKLNQLRLAAAEFQKYSQCVLDTQVWEIFQKASIVLMSKDRDTLQTFITQTKQNDQIDFNKLLKLLKIDEQPSMLLQDIQKQLKTNVFQQYKNLQFGDFKNCLLSGNVSLPKTNEVLNKLFLLISEQQNIVSRNTLERYLYPIQNTQPKTIKPLPNPPSSFKDFKNFLFVQKIDLMQLFNDCIKTKRIPEARFLQFIKQINFVSLQEKQEFISFFQEKDSQINFPKLTTYIKLDKNYGKVQNQSSQQAAITMVDSLPHDIRIILSKLAASVRNKTNLFSNIDTNNDGKITLQELDYYCVKHGLSEGISKENFNRMFKYIDTNGDELLQIDEITQTINNYNLWHNVRLNTAFTPKFEAQLVLEIQEIFDKIDKDKNKYLSADELVLAMKQQDSYSIDISQARELSFKLSSDGKITKDKFVDYILPRQKEQLLSIQDSMEDLRQLFRKYSKSKGTFDEQSNMDKTSLKDLVFELGFKSVSDLDIDLLFSDIDTNLSGLIDEQEFMAYMHAFNKIGGEQLKSADVLMQIRKAHMKLNNTFFEQIRQLPQFSTISFTQKQLENDQKQRSSASLLPQFNFKEMKFTNLSKGNEFKTLQAKQFIGKYKPKFSLECSVVDIIGVPNIFQQSEQNHYEIRYFLFDDVRKVNVSSIQVCQATSQSKGKFSSNWTVPESLKQFYIRGSENWRLIIELVSIDVKDDSKQFTVGWTSCPILQLKPAKLKLPLAGGTLFHEAQIITKENDIKPSTGLLKKLTGQKAPVVERHITLEVKTFEKFDETTQANLSLLPENIIIWKNLIGFASSLRLYCYNELIKDQILMQKPKANLILSQFSKIYDNPDVQLSLAEFLPYIMAKKTFEQQSVIIQNTIQRLYGLIYEPNFKFNSVYPTRSTINPTYQVRYDALSRAILQEDTTLAAFKNLKKPTQIKDEILYQEEYIPFTAQELHDVLGDLGLDKQKELFQFNQ